MTNIEGRPEICSILSSSSSLKIEDCIQKEDLSSAISEVCWAMRTLQGKVNKVKRLLGQPTKMRTRPQDNQTPQRLFSNARSLLIEYYRAEAEATGVEPLKKFGAHGIRAKMIVSRYTDDEIKAIFIDFFDRRESKKEPYPITFDEFWRTLPARAQRVLGK